MIKIIFTLFFIVIFQFQAFGETLRASASFDEPIKSFYGTWHVTSKIESTNNPSKFNKLSVDIWNLSG